MSGDTTDDRSSGYIRLANPTHTPGLFPDSGIAFCAGHTLVA